MSRTWNEQEGSVEYVCRSCNTAQLQWTQDADAQPGVKKLGCESCDRVLPHDRRRAD